MLFTLSILVDCSYKEGRGDFILKIQSTTTNFSNCFAVQNRGIVYTHIFYRYNRDFVFIMNNTSYTHLHFSSNSGPAVSVLTHFISKRAACLLGSTIATIGVVGCYFANSITWIILFYGVVHGKFRFCLTVEPH